MLICIVPVQLLLKSKNGLFWCWCVALSCTDRFKGNFLELKSEGLFYLKSDSNPVF